MTAMTLSGRNMKGALPAQAMHALQVLGAHAHDERNLHLSAVLNSIRDDGPALIDGEVQPEQPILRHVPGPAALAEPPASVMPLPTAGGRAVRMLAAACLVLTIALSGAIAIALHSESRIAVLEGQIQMLLERP